VQIHFPLPCPNENESAFQLSRASAARGMEATSSVRIPSRVKFDAAGASREYQTKPTRFRARSGRESPELPDSLIPGKLLAARRLAPVTRTYVP